MRTSGLELQLEDSICHQASYIMSMRELAPELALSPCDIDFICERRACWAMLDARTLARYRAERGASE